MGSRLTWEYRTVSATLQIQIRILCSVTEWSMTMRNPPWLGQTHSSSLLLSLSNAISCATAKTMRNSPIHACTHTSINHEKSSHAPKLQSLKSPPNASRPIHLPPRRYRKAQQHPSVGANKTNKQSRTKKNIPCLTLALAVAGPQLFVLFLRKFAIAMASLEPTGADLPQTLHEWVVRATRRGEILSPIWRGGGRARVRGFFLHANFRPPGRHVRGFQLSPNWALIWGISEKSGH